MQKNNGAWSSFFSLLRLKREGRLPPHITRVSPPRYWKERGKRKRILVIRQDRYVVDEENHKIILKDFRWRSNLLVDWCGSADRVG